MTVYFAIILTVLLGFCGLAVDTARMELRTTQLQAAVDAAALAAAGELLHQGTGSNWQTAATNDVATIEAADGIPSTGAPTLQTGASYGPYVGDNSTVQATITQSFPTIFLGLLTKGNASVTLSVTAVAQMPPCMIFLGDPAVSGTYDYWSASAGESSASNYACPTYFKDGLTIDYFGNINGSQARTSGPPSASNVTGGTTWPIMYNVPVVQDPLAYIPLPTPAPQCTNSSGPISQLSQSSSAVFNYSPGTYCGATTTNPTFIPGPGTSCGQTGSRTTPAIDIEGSWGGCPTQGGTDGNNCTTRPTVNFAAGLYIFIGGVNFTCATVTGTGVTMYFTKSNSVGYGLMKVISTAWNVSAPTITNTGTGQIAGIAVMNDPNWSGGVQDFQLTYSNWYADGVIYLRKTGLDAYSLRMQAPDYLNIVAANMYTYDAGVNPAANYSVLPAGNPLHTVVSLVQ